MLGLLLAVGMSLGPAPTVRAELAIPSDYRWALLAGLQRRLGGNFIIAGLEGAQGDCDRQKTCATPAALDVTAPLVVAGTSDTRASGVEIYGKSPVAIVSIIDARWDRNSLDMHLAVFDPVTRTVTKKRARVGFDALYDANGVNGTKRLRSLNDM